MPQKNLQRVRFACAVCDKACGRPKHTDKWDDCNAALAVPCGV